jgi:hypothetical protein
MDFHLFQADCEAATSQLHHPATDGPLLVCIQLQAARSVLQRGTWFTYPTYAAAIAEWPATGPVYYESPQEAIAALVTDAAWRRIAQVDADYEVVAEVFTLSYAD